MFDKNPVGVQHENKIKNTTFFPKSERDWDKFCTRIRVITDVLSI
jgi:hypothetical protein